ncbi:lysophospholipid acyltransferase family protein [Oligoflexia bacterium]|nr:lysophospholipid acyltransferase family protein [Oligoflexia bacterium]
MKIKILFLKCIAKLLGALPVGLRSLLGKCLGFLFSFIPTRDRAVAKLQLRAFLGKERSFFTLPRAYASVVQTLMEALNLAPMIKHAERYISSPDQEFIESLVSRKKCVVTLSAHTGNWELMAAYMIKLGAPLSTVARVAKNAAFHNLLADLRSAYGIRTLWRSDTEGSKVIVKEMQAQRVVAALIDQDTHVSSVFSPFFGHPAKSPSGLVALAQRYEAIIVTAFVFRTGFNRYEFHVEEIDNTLSIQEIIDEYNRRLEHYIRRYPDQWVWFHRRWRSTEDGQRMSGAAYLEYLSSL